MSQIKISGLTFGYEGSFDTVFENVSFEIDTDWKLGFTGRNGRGKTTFLNLLMNKYEFGGTITSSVIFDYFPFDVEDSALNTISAVESISADFQLYQLEKELSLLDVSHEVLYRPFSSLSHGEQTKVLLAALFLKDGHFLLIDEPTNHLDMNARKIVSDYLNTKKGFILVSHDRAFLDDCIDHILSINKTSIDVQSGNFTSWWHNKVLQDNYELAENKRLRSDMKRLGEAAERTAAWSDKVEKSKIGTGALDKGYIGHKAAKMMKRSRSIEKRRLSALNEKSALLKNVEENDSLSLSPLRYVKDRLAELKDVSISFGERTVFRDLSFTINRGDRVALIGRNGSGKTSIIRALLKESVPFAGSLHVGSGLIISYVSQDTSWLKGDLKDFALGRGIDESLFKAILRKLDFSRDQFEKDMADFSAGQKKKVLIAKSLCEKAHLYIWDEPLNFIDVISRMQIEDLILKHQPTMLFVEHDSAFVRAVATKHVVL